MIKINILSSSLIKKEERKELLIIAYVIAGLVVFVCLFNYGLKFYSYKKLAVKIESSQKELTKYEGIVRQVEALQTTKAVLETKKNLINTLSSTALMYPVFMNKLLSVLPDNIWFSSMDTKSTTDTDMNVNIEAEALDNFSIADFLSVLTTNQSFSNPELGAINTNASNKILTYSFKIKFDYKKELSK